MNLVNSFINEDGSLEFTTTDNCSLWKGKPLDLAVERIYKIENSNDFIVILNGIEARERGLRNLFRITCFGTIVWQVDKPREELRSVKGLSLNDDLYTGITRIDNCTVYGYSFIGYSDHINLENGKIISSDFVK